MLSLLQIFKEFYEFEFSLRDSINSKIATALGFISVYVAGFGFLLGQLRAICRFSNEWWLHVTPALLSLVVFIVALVYCWKTFYGYEYQTISPKMLNNYFMQLDHYYTENYVEYYSQEGTQKELMQCDIEEALMSQYCVIAESTHQNNKLKHQRYKTFSSLFLASVMIVGAEIIVLLLL
ncbi:MAG: hypothetical protein LBI64_07700 [Coriobacteriales bacterium]|jgi:hypothetical protein|nr:hypothetical protein [Coriobacteriales bacterium]